MKIIRSLLALSLAGFLALSAQAQDRGTKEEAKAMAESAALHVKKVGVDQAMKDFTGDKASWVRKDLYVFAFDLKANWLAHGTNEKLVGKNMIDLKDQNGKPFVREIIQVVTTKGEGWVDYDWSNPATKKVDGKTTFVKRVAGTEVGVAVGAYR